MLEFQIQKESQPPIARLDEILYSNSEPFHFPVEFQREGVRLDGKIVSHVNS